MQHYVSIISASHLTVNYGQKSLEIGGAPKLETLTLIKKLFLFNFLYTRDSFISPAVISGEIPNFCCYLRPPMSHFTSFASGVSLSPSSSASALITNGWFAETEAMWPGQKFCIQVDEVLLNGRSEFQDILVFKSSTYGNVLVLGKLLRYCLYLFFFFFYSRPCSC